MMPTNDDVQSNVNPLAFPSGHIRLFTVNESGLKDDLKKLLANLLRANLISCFYHKNSRLISQSILNDFQENLDSYSESYQTFLANTQPSIPKKRRRSFHRILLDMISPPPKFTPIPREFNFNSLDQIEQSTRSELFEIEKLSALTSYSVPMLKFFADIRRLSIYKVKNGRQLAKIFLNKIEAAAFFRIKIPDDLICLHKASLFLKYPFDLTYTLLQEHNIPIFGEKKFKYCKESDLLSIKNSGFTHEVPEIIRYLSTNKFIKISEGYRLFQINPVKFKSIIVEQNIKIFMLQTEKGFVRYIKIKDFKEAYQVKPKKAEMLSVFLPQIQELASQLIPRKTIAKTLNISYIDLCNLVNKHGIKTTTNKCGKNFIELKNEILDLIAKGHPIREIAKRLEVKRTAIRFWIRKHGLPTPRREVKPTGLRFSILMPQIFEMLSQGKRVDEIAEHLNIQKEILLRYIYKRSWAHLIQKKIPKVNDYKEQIIELLRKKVKVKDIASILGVNFPTLKTWIHRYKLNPKKD